MRTEMGRTALFLCIPGQGPEEPAGGGKPTMLSLNDCLDFIDLDADTIDVIAVHEQVPTIVAAELGNQLLADLRGIFRLHQIHRELITRAAEKGALSEEQRLRAVYARFSRKYPVPRLLT